MKNNSAQGITHGGGGLFFLLDIVQLSSWHKNPQIDHFARQLAASVVFDGHDHSAKSTCTKQSVAQNVTVAELLAPLSMSVAAVDGSPSLPPSPSPGYSQISQDSGLRCWP
jgi:hypothetical protein